MVGNQECLKEVISDIARDVVLGSIFKQLAQKLGESIELALSNTRRIQNALISFVHIVYSFLGSRDELTFKMDHETLQ